MPEFMKVEIDGEEMEVVKREEFESEINSSKESWETEKKELEEKLEKLNNKDLNFSNLRKNLDAEQEEKKKIAERLTEIDEQLKTFKKETTGTVKEKYLNQFSSGDNELKEKLTKEYDSFSGELFKEEDIFARMTKAAKILGIELKKNDNVFFGGVSVDGSSGKTLNSSGFVESERGKALLKRVDAMRGIKNKE